MMIYLKVLSLVVGVVMLITVLFVTVLAIWFGFVYVVSHL